MILIIAAMNDELEEILKRLKNRTEEPLFKPQSMPFQYLYHGFYNDREVLVARTGIGRTNSAAVLSYVLAKYQVKKIINLGMAGGSPDLKVGEIVKVKEARYLDVDVTYFGYQLHQVPRLPEKFISTIQTNLGLKELPIYTAETFQTQELGFNKPYLVDMEAAALFHVAYLYQVPIISFKYVSDLVGHTKQDEMYQTSEKTSSKVALATFLTRYLKEEYLL